MDLSPSAWVPVGDGHTLHVQHYGTSGTIPAVVLHGGPGSGISQSFLALFDPARFHVTLFDQRGAGQSRPNAADDLAALNNNTTQHLIADIEALRIRAGHETWLVYGGSWGATLALAYAETHPDRVSSVVLSAVTTTTAAEIDWLYGGAGAEKPTAFGAFEAGTGLSGTDLVRNYNTLLRDPDPAVHQTAADRWCDWEAAAAETVLAPRSKRWDDPAFRLRFARLAAHYFANLAWLEPDQILRNSDRLNGIEGHLIHSRGDLTARLAIPEALVQRWLDANLTIIEGDLHGAVGSVAAGIRTATDGIWRRHRARPGGEG